MTRYAIGLGSNEGNRLEHLRSGMQDLESLGSIEAVSSLYETAPVGGPEQAPFLNAVTVVESSLEPASLLDRLQEIEEEAGRKRTVRWGPRTLDLDILVSDGVSVATGDLVVPHPRAREREFVLRPLSEIWPTADVGGVQASGALGEVGDQGVERLWRSWRDDSDLWIGWLLVAVQLVWFVAIAVSFAADGSLPGDDPEFSRLAGAVMAFLGIVLAFTATRRLGPGLTALPEPVDAAPLVDTGPYALVRHPIYGGVILFLTGTALFLESVLGLVLSVGLSGLFWVKSKYEEKRLRIRYAGYRDYLMRVRHRLIPFVF